ncbi:adenosylcobinamide-GDP ribazoletransferase [Lentilactobacillus diolivorans]|uniref:Adenosylcobinamide-GDP ribazoletransferase n=2 Tax=Lentilactobacillus diolivorans TaxID=179838 RepID=A0A0R1S4D7_9LACO|nr:adenosylcobinamide-GDP ribazoletransferase [Lentilactobacillus diolivorans]KRL62452.1 adenosylcobinamide-GDP ribazoletransferase [Lentilactobacillus diolivorans DSM 14421]GEP24217.1 adenosylcobinamide-GDP ribazoletransferase [Lentilactobacillus diolivorans]
MGQAMILFAQFFTRISIPVEIPDVTNKFKGNIQYFTLFGFLIGALEAGFFWLMSLVFPVWFAWVAFWIFDGILTGGFHLDALADTADGLFSSRKPERMHEIMKDSRLGTMGSLALLYFYMIVIGVGLVVANRLSLWQMAGLVAVSTMMAKAGIALLFYKMLYAGTGLASIWTGVSTWRIIVAQLFSIIVIGGLLRIPGLISYVMVLIFVYFYRRHIIHILGGLSGDPIGACGVLSQAVFLLVYAGLTKVIL